jgi:glycosyltransferase involved in cell wall biosynthesis
MDLRMKILILAPFLWSGAGAAITRLAIEFARRGKHCDVVSSGRSKGLQDWDKFILQLRRASIKYRTIDLFDRDPSSVWKSVKALIEIIEENEYDLIHVHSGSTAMAASIARDMIGIEIPIVATMHSWNPERPEWMNWADVWALNRCDKIVAVSESYKDYLIRNGVIKNKTLTIHLGTDIPALSAKKPKANKKDVFIVLSVGRIEKRKDQETLVRGFNLFRKQVKNAILEIVGPAGESEYETNLIRRMKDIVGTKNVHCKGMVKDTSSYFM